jgi:hypothetical protein
MGVGIEPRPGPYLVMKDVNVRAGPKKTAKRVGSLKKGDRVHGVGRAAGSTWIGVQRNGADLGFVYSPILMPLIDGTLKGNLTGMALTGGGTSCRYSVAFEGMGEVQGGRFQTADYEIDFQCQYKGRHYSFTAPMFITEAPYRLSARNPVYQISIDILEVEEGYDEVFSTVFLYQRLKDRVVYDGASLKGYARPPRGGEKPAATVGEALTGAVEMAVGAWGEKVWKALASGE